MKVTWQDRIKAWASVNKLAYVRLSEVDRAEVNAFMKATENMTMLEIMAYTKKTQPDGRHPLLKHRENQRAQNIQGRPE